MHIIFKAVSFVSDGKPYALGPSSSRSQQPGGRTTQDFHPCLEITNKDADFYFIQKHKFSERDNDFSEYFTVYDGIFGMNMCV